MITLRDRPSEVGVKGVGVGGAMISTHWKGGILAAAVSHTHTLSIHMVSVIWRSSGTGSWIEMCESSFRMYYISNRLIMTVALSESALEAIQAYLQGILKLGSTYPKMSAMAPHCREVQVCRIFAYQLVLTEIIRRCFSLPVRIRQRWGPRPISLHIQIRRCKRRLLIRLDMVV